MTRRLLGAQVARCDRARRRYRPRSVRVLMVAESQPASGRCFYQADSGLYRAVRDVFTAAYSPTEARAFLESFRDRGWDLVDLCRTPTNHCAPPARRRAHAQAVPGLARTVRRLRPHAVVLVVRMISPSVRRALRLAGWSGPYYELPYPGRWVAARHAFARELRGVLQRLRGSECGAVEHHDRQ